MPKPDLSTFRKPIDPKEAKKKRKQRVVIFLIIFTLIIVLSSVLWWMMFKKTPSFSGDKVTFSLKGPNITSSGNQITLRAVYENKEEVELENVEINFLYPDGFEFDSSKPKSPDLSQKTWSIGKIEAGKKGTVEISGRLVGDPDEVKKFSATMRYKPANFNSNFTLEDTKEVTISRTNISLETKIPSSLQSDTLFEYSIFVANRGNEPITNLKIKSIYPSSFQFESSTPTPSRDRDEWNIVRLGKNERKEIKISGKIFGEVDEDKIFKTQVGLVDKNNQFYLQNEVENEIKIVKVDAEIEETIDDKTESTANFGDILEYKIHYKNTGTESLQDVAIEAEIDPSLLSKKDIVVNQGRYENGKAIWDKTSLSSLSLIEPNQEGEVSFKVKIIDSPKKVKNTFIKSKAILKSAKVSSLGDKEFIKESNQTKVNLNTEVDVSVEARYFDKDGDPVGSGPLPPKVGKKTTYQVILSVANLFSDVSDAKIELELSDQVSFESANDDSDLSFNKNKIIWEIGNLKAGTKNLERVLDISITPTKDQVGKAGVLIKKILFSGKDIKTGGILSEEFPSIDTELESDSKAKDKGKVVE